VAERDEFELPVPISEQSGYNGVAAPRRIVGIAGGSIAGSAYQHSKETFPSSAMNDVATDVAAAIQ
jgi:hypothetical protein